MPICPHCFASLDATLRPGDKCPHCGAQAPLDEGLAGKQTFELIPGGSSDNVLDDFDVAEDDEATLPFGQTIEIDDRSASETDIYKSDINKPAASDSDNSDTVDVIDLEQAKKDNDANETVDEITLGEQVVEEIVIDDSDEEDESDNDRTTLQIVGGATEEFDAPIEVDSDDAPPAPKDDRSTVDFVGDATIELTGPAMTGGTVDNQAPVDNRGTVDFDSDKTIQLSSSDPELAAKMSSQWMGTIELNSPSGQTVRQDEGESVAKQKSTLPVKPRTLSPAAGNKGTVTYLSPADAPDYELLKQIGEGGMGVVYAARQSSIARTVAVKMLKPSAKVGAEQRDKFISEAVVTGELDHPNIVPIYDLGSNEQGALFYSMKHVQGTPWEDVLAKKTLDENLNILLRVADAMAFAHARGVVHRDLKPENVMLGEFGEVLVMDWGLARVTKQFPNAASIHQSDSLGGTPAYMSPEMARGPVEAIDHTSDIYLLGAMLYEIIGDRPPHSGRDVMQCLMAAAQNTIDSIKYDGELRDVALKAMETEQAKRYQSVKEFQDAVRQYLSHSESLVLATHAERHLSEARESHDYQLFARALYGFQESLTLWQENAKARTLLTETELAYASQALTVGDLDLAESLLDDAQPAHAEVLANIRQAQRERTARQSMFKWTRRAVAALVVAFIVLGTFSYIKIANSNVQIAKQRDEAKRQEGIANQNADLAAKNAKIAEANAEEARKNAKEADEQRQIAVSERDEAERQRAEADRLRKIADANRQEALTQKKQAEAAKDEAVEARNREEYEAYVASIGLAAAKIDENAYDFALELLNATPSTRRDWEWGRLRYLCQLSAAVYAAQAPVDAVAYSPDGRLIASGDRDGVLTLREADGGKVIASPHLGQYVYCVAFAPQGQLVAAGISDGTIRLVDTATGEVTATLTGHTDGVLDVAFSPNGQQLVSGSYDNTARVWDLATGKATAKLAGHNWWVWSARFSPDAQRIVTASQDSNVIVWRRDATGTFAPVAYFTDHEGPVYAAAFSPTGSTIATCGYDKTIRLWSPDQVGELDLQSRVVGDGPRQSTAKVLVGHTGAVRSVAFDRAGELLLSGGHDNTVRLWNATSGEPLKTLRGHGSRVESVALTADGSHAVSGSQDATVRVWDVAGYAESHVLGSRTLAGHSDAVLAARFAADGRVLTASRDRTAKLWDAAGEELARFAQGHEFLATSAQFIDAGQRLITGAGDNTARVWSVGSGAELMVLRGTGRNGIIAADAAGHYLVTGGAEAEVQLWDIATGERMASLPGHAGEVTAAAFDATGKRFATGDDNGKILVWQLTDGDALTPATQVAELVGHSRTVTALRFAPDGQVLYSASGDNTCAKWNLATGTEATDGLLKHSEWIAAMDLSADGQWIATACEDGYVRLWSVATGKQVSEATLGESTATGVDFAPDGRTVLVTSADSRAVWRWDPAAGESVNLAQQPPLATADTAGTLWTAYFTPDGERILTVGGNDARLLDLATGNSGVRFSPHGAVAAVAMSADGRLVATGSWDGTAKLWDAQTHRMVGQLVGGHTGYINSLDFSPTGDRLATASDDGTVRLWDVASNQPIGEPLAEHTGSVHSVRFSHDGRQLLTTSSDHTAKLWDAHTGEVLHTFADHQWSVLCGEFSRDGKWIVTGGQDNTARVWSTSTGELQATLSGHTSAVTSVAFTPDATRVLTGSQDTTAKLWDADNGNEILTLSGHTQDLTAVDFSSDGRTALTASRDGTAILWPTVDWQ